MTASKLPVTILLAARNEAANLPKCLAALGPAERVVVLDSHSTDGTPDLARAAGAEVTRFDYPGGYPKKRQWALDTLDIRTDWVLFLDADEVVLAELWAEIAAAVADPASPNGFLVTKGFHFLGRRLRWGGFSFAAVLLVRRGKARFERLLADAGDGLDMEVHERVIVDGPVGRLRTPLVHDDDKGLHAYFDRHNRYSTWEAALRHRFLTGQAYGEDTIRPRPWGNTQERRRWLKGLVIRLPFEPWLWFVYHYWVKLGVLEGHRGLIACQVRAAYIREVRAKVHERRLAALSKPSIA